MTLKRVGKAIDGGNLAAGPDQTADGQVPPEIRSVRGRLGDRDECQDERETRREALDVLLQAATASARKRTRISFTPLMKFDLRRRGGAAISMSRKRVTMPRKISRSSRRARVAPRQ